jgi:hypothetical protein
MLAALTFGFPAVADAHDDDNQPAIVDRTNEATVSDAVFPELP